MVAELYKGGYKAVFLLSGEETYAVFRFFSAGYLRHSSEFSPFNSRSENPGENRELSIDGAVAEFSSQYSIHILIYPIKGYFMQRCGFPKKIGQILVVSLCSICPCPPAPAKGQGAFIGVFLLPSADNIFWRAIIASSNVLTVFVVRLPLMQTSAMNFPEAS